VASRGRAGLSRAQQESDGPLAMSRRRCAGAPRDARTCRGLRTEIEGDAIDDEIEQVKGDCREGKRWDDQHDSVHEIFSASADTTRAVSQSTCRLGSIQVVAAQSGGGGQLARKKPNPHAGVSYRVSRAGNRTPGESLASGSRARLMARICSMPVSP
jgi:hypothetical protein